MSATVSLGLGASAAAGQDDDLAISSNVQEERGLELLGGRLWISAFANLAFEALENHPEEINLDDLGILARWDAFERLSFFVALELEDTLTWIDGDGVSSFEEPLALERLYADVRLGSSTTLRAGKMLTPFGIWNPIRRAPLTWTVERPLVTEIAFPLHVTGFALSHKTTIGDWSVDADVYGQPATELDRISDEKAADGFVGGRVAVGHSIPGGFATLGVQAAWFEDVDTDNQEYAAGLDLDVSFHRLLLTSEAIFLDAEIDDHASGFGAYLQAVHPIWSQLFGVARGEYVAVDDRSDFRSLTLGLAWRAESQRWVLKLDYQFTGNELDGRTDGVLVELSFLF